MQLFCNYFSFSEIAEIQISTRIALRSRAIDNNVLELGEVYGKGRADLIISVVDCMMFANALFTSR